MNFHHYAVPDENLYFPEVINFPWPGRIFGALDKRGLI